MTERIIVDSPAEEGDPNHWWRNAADGPGCSWARADELGTNDRLLLSNKYVHTVVVSEKSERDLWHLTIANPTLIDSSPHDAEDVTASMPQVRDIVVRPSALYRVVR
jgi:hypothetical protein